jgi:hypothetical protein
MFLALGIQHATGMHNIVIFGLFESKIFLHIFSQMSELSKKNVVEHKICVLIFSTNFD